MKNWGTPAHSGFVLIPLFKYMKIVFMTYQTSSQLIILTEQTILKSVTADQIDLPFCNMGCPALYFTDQK